MPTLNTNLELTEFPKASTLPTVCQTHFSEIIDRTPGAIFCCFTDGSNQNGRIKTSLFNSRPNSHVWKPEYCIRIHRPSFYALRTSSPKIPHPTPNLSHNFRLSSPHLGHLKTRLSSPLGQPNTHSTHLSKHHFMQNHFHVDSRSLWHSRQ